MGKVAAPEPLIGSDLRKCSGASGVRTHDLTVSELYGAQLCRVMGHEYHMPRSKA